MYCIFLIGTYPITGCKIYQRGFLIIVLNCRNSCKYNISLVFFLEKKKLKFFKEFSFLVGVGVK